MAGPPRLHPRCLTPVLLYRGHPSQPRQNSRSGRSKRGTIVYAILDPRCLAIHPKLSTYRLSARNQQLLLQPVVKSSEYLCRNSSKSSCGTAQHTTNWSG
jgi:hypothetical protein